MRISKNSLALVLFAFACPQLASAGEVVSFELSKSELGTAESRQGLLDRMTRHATRSCEVGSPIIGKKAVKDCADDIVDQFVTEIDHSELSALAASRARTPYLSASR